jgi:hypothetical protein
VSGSATGAKGWTLELDPLILLSFRAFSNAMSALENERPGREAKALIATFTRWSIFDSGACT